MPSLHFDNFARAYGITTPGKSEKNTYKAIWHRYLSLAKMSAYIPILGTLSQVLFATVICLDRSILTGCKIAWVSRAVLSPVALFALPVVDSIATIIFAVKKKKNGGENPISTF